MMRVLVLSMALMAAAPALADEFPNGLSPDGIGEVKIGMPVEKIELLLRDKLGYNQFSSRGCSVLTTKKLEPSGLSVMIESKLLTRINVDYFGKSTIPKTIKTTTGVGLGSTEADVMKAYPGARVKANPADPTWHTIIADAPDHTKGIVFETNGKTVKSMRAGAYPAIAYANGCD
jgi:hypothetical protein